MIRAEIIFLKQFDENNILYVYVDKVHANIKP